MENFTESSKIIRKFAINKHDSNIEFFNNSKIQGFFDYKKDFIKMLNEVNTYLNKTKTDDHLHAYIPNDLEMIFENKLNYIEKNIYNEEFKKHSAIIDECTVNIQRIKDLIEPLINLSKYVAKLQRAKESLLSDEKHTYSFSEKRLEVINKKIDTEKAKIAAYKKEAKNLIKNKDEINESLDALELLFKKMDVDSLPKYNTNMALKFIKETSNNDVLNFLNIKTVEDNILDRYVMTKGQKNEEVIIFKDSSIASKKHGVYESPQIVSGNYIELSKEICHDVVTYLLRKRPKLIEPFLKKMTDENFNLPGVFVAINSCLKNEQILKNYNFDSLEELKAAKSLEVFDDEVAKVKQKHDIQTFADSIISTKYKHLYNDRIYDQMKSLVELKVTKDELQNNIGRKMAGFEKSSDLNGALQKYINSLQDFEMDSMLNKVSKNKADISVQEDKLLIVRIHDFDASKSLGSASWCISRSVNHFESYVYDRSATQFFVYDFSKEANDDESMIGITLDSYGDRSASHLKNDDTLYSDSKIFKSLQKKIIVNNLELFPNLSDRLKKDLGIKDDVKSTKIKNAF